MGIEPTINQSENLDKFTITNNNINRFFFGRLGAGAYCQGEKTGEPWSSQ